MKDDRWIVVRNWDKFQHYSNRDPAWIKFYTSLNAEDEWRQLSFAQRGLLASIWAEYARSKGRLRVIALGQLVGQRVDKRTLEALNHAGFIAIVASKPLALKREEKKKKELGAHAPKKPVDNSSVQRANVLPKDPIKAIETMIHNGVITDPVDLEAELAALDLNTTRNSNLADKLRALITQEGT